MRYFGASLPTIDKSTTLSTTDLKRRGLLALDFHIGVFNWRTFSATYIFEIVDDNLKRIVLQYTDKDGFISYAIDIVATPTNLGHGKRWYFRCPATGTRCLNLIKPIGSKYFLHRSAFPQMIYSKQKWSKAERQVMGLTNLFEIEKLEEEQRRKYKKTHYRGKPTPLNRKIKKKYAKLEKALEILEGGALPFQE